MRSVGIDYIVDFLKTFKTFMCMSVCVTACMCITRVSCLQRPDKGVGFLEAGVLIPWSSEEQLVLLTTSYLSKGSA